jgi:phytoene synthase
LADGAIGQRTASPPLELHAAQAHCRRLARREAANFYWGFVALPPEQRAAIYGLYCFARQVDDAVDGGGGRAELERQRLRLRRCLEGHPEDPVTEVLSWARGRYAIPDDELEAVLRGVELDLVGGRYETYAELEGYCRLVASAVGRMCVRIFGFSDPAALAHADRLGIALQLINILRDVREDGRLGRIYLPLDALRASGVSPEGLLAGRPGSGWPTFVEAHVQRARHELADGLQVSRYVPLRARACVRTMAGIYERILERIAADPELPLRERVSVPQVRKLEVMARSWLPG